MGDEIDQKISTNGFVACNKVIIPSDIFSSDKTSVTTFSEVELSVEFSSLLITSSTWYFLTLSSILLSSEETTIRFLGICKAASTALSTKLFPFTNCRFFWYMPLLPPLTGMIVNNFFNIYSNHISAYYQIWLYGFPIIHFSVNIIIKY